MSGDVDSIRSTSSSQEHNSSSPIQQQQEEEVRGEYKQSPVGESPARAEEEEGSKMAEDTPTAAVVVPCNGATADAEENPPMGSGEENKADEVEGLNHDSAAQSPHNSTTSTPQIEQQLPESRGRRSTRGESPTSRRQQSTQQQHRRAAKTRRLKLYGVEEKLDIIDYAKAIGNRAAGREFNVAESSIREWRKNEHKLRQQMRGGGGGGEQLLNTSRSADSSSSSLPSPAGAANTSSDSSNNINLAAPLGYGMLRFEESNPELMGEIDRTLVDFVLERWAAASQSNGVVAFAPATHSTRGMSKADAATPVDWKTIRHRAEELWHELEENPDTASLLPTNAQPGLDGCMITMGWVARFMRRNASALPTIPPPPSAPSITGHGGSYASGSTMQATETAIRKAAASPALLSPPTITNGNHASSAKTTRKSQPAKSAGDKTSNFSPPLKQGDIVNNSSSPQEQYLHHRRKCLVPRRAVNPTFLTTSMTTPTMLDDALANDDQDDNDGDFSSTFAIRADDDGGQATAAAGKKKLSKKRKRQQEQQPLPSTWAPKAHSTPDNSPRKRWGKADETTMQVPANASSSIFPLSQSAAASQQPQRSSQQSARVRPAKLSRREAPMEEHFPASPLFGGVDPTFSNGREAQVPSAVNLIKPPSSFINLLANKANDSTSFTTTTPSTTTPTVSSLLQQLPTALTAILLQQQASLAATGSSASTPQNQSMQPSPTWHHSAILPQRGHPLAHSPVPSMCTPSAAQPITAINPNSASSANSSSSSDQARFAAALLSVQLQQLGQTLLNFNSAVDNPTGVSGRGGAGGISSQNIDPALKQLICSGGVKESDFAGINNSSLAGQPLLLNMANQHKQWPQLRPSDKPAAAVAMPQLNGDGAGHGGNNSSNALRMPAIDKSAEVAASGLDATKAIALWLLQNGGQAGIVPTRGRT